MLLPAGATAAVAIVIATGIVAATESGPGTAALDRGSTGRSAGPPVATPVPQSATSGNSAASGAGLEAESLDAIPAPASEHGFFDAKARHRDIERSANLVLGADPSEVGEDAAKVFDAVHTYHGVVLSSSVDGGAAGHAGARFELTIPSAKLDDALAALSAIAEVRSRHDATSDITAPTVSFEEHLQDSQAKVDGLLVQLAGAETDSERAEVEAVLSAERRHAAVLHSQLTRLHKQASLSRVSLRIETGGAPASSGGSGGGWGAGDALGDAGHILGIAAGVTIVGLAVLGPFALIALLVWLGTRAWIRRDRKRALD
jgi:hypothetical protein